MSDFIDLRDLDVDLKSVGVDEQVRLAFTVLAKHVNAVFVRLDAEQDERERRDAYYRAMEGYR